MGHLRFESVVIAEMLKTWAEVNPHSPLFESVVIAEMLKTDKAL